MKRYHLGRKINFVCVATGKPRPSIIWLKDGLELNSYSGYEHAGVSIPGVSSKLISFINSKLLIFFLLVEMGTILSFGILDKRVATWKISTQKQS